MYIKYLVALLIVISQLSFGIAKEASSGYTIIEDKAQTAIKTPAFSEKKIRKIRLDNGFQAILVSDPKTDQSAATIAIEAGSWQDPDQFPGIAHFLEHMLFLGTKKYPKESEYHNFITEHGGFANAFTTNDYTAYMFSVNNEAFPEALDRFSNFFKEPLFNPSGVSRELNAIDQEYAKNYENDDIREIMVMKELENPAHPNHRFTMGNSSTLSSVSQETLKQWYEDHYSANLMRLYIISNLSLDEMTQLVVKDFAEVKNKDKQPFVAEVALQNPAMQGKYIYIQPIKNVRTLTLVWDLPEKFWYMKDTRPDRLICHVLGHEGKEGLLAELKREKLAESLQCMTYDVGGKNLILFVSIELTDDGLQHVDHVILRSFQTLAMMRKQLYPKYLFDEVQQINLIDYEYQKREDAFDTAMKTAEILTGEDIATFPEQTKIIQKFDPQDVMDLLNYLTPENSRFLIKAPSSVTGLKPTEQEKWLNVPYAIKPIDPATMREWSEAQPVNQITLPPANIFLPRTLELLNSSSGNAQDLPLVVHPAIIENSDHGHIYYAPDERYLTPQIYLYFNIKTPAVDMGNPHHVVIADMYVKALEESLSKFSYPATVAGLDFSIDRSNYGINFKIMGYSDNAPLLFNEILKQLKDVQVSEQKFKIYKQSLLREYHNFNKEMPLKRAKEFFQQVVYKSYASEGNKAVAIRKLTYDRFEDAVQDLYKKSFVEGLIYGNVTTAQAQAYSQKLLETLDSVPYPKEEQVEPKVIVLPFDKGPFFFEAKIPAQGNATMLAIEYPDYSFKNRAAQQILMKAMDEPFFSELRTKQQTGYLVFSAGEEIEKKLFNAFLVQSNTHDPQDLLARFELFVESFLQELGKSYLSKENFEAIKMSILQELEKPQNNMEAMGDLVFRLAFKYDADFDWIDKRIQGFKELSYEEFLNFAHVFMGKANKRRLAILVKGNIPEDKSFSYIRIGDINQLKKLSTYSAE